MGMVHAYKRGKLKNASPKVKEAAKTMTDKSAKEFAETKRTGLPEKKSHNTLADLRNGSGGAFLALVRSRMGHKRGKK
jgi:hypothetical protein